MWWGGQSGKVGPCGQKEGPGLQKNSCWEHHAFEELEGQWRNISDNAQKRRVCLEKACVGHG